MNFYSRFRIFIGLLVIVVLFFAAWFLYYSDSSISATNPIVEDVNEPNYLETMERGYIDPNFEVVIYDPDKAYNGTTFAVDKTGEGPRIIEVNMLGEIVWEYKKTEWVAGGIDDVEWLPESDTIIFMYHSTKGDTIYEIDRDGNILFALDKAQGDHDVDKLKNGNYLYVYGMGDTLNDAAVKEVSPEGKIVWEWYVKDHLDPEIYQGIENEGVAHTNAVIRLDNGHTLISPRNFNFLVEVDANGDVIDFICEEVCVDQHEPEILKNGHILMANHGSPQKVMEIDPNTDEIVWENIITNAGYYPLRDADRLPNGNTLITGTKGLIEVTEEGEIVWKFDIVPEISFGQSFYKAQRIKS